MFPDGKHISTLDSSERFTQHGGPQHLFKLNVARPYLMLTDFSKSWFSFGGDNIVHVRSDQWEFQLYFVKVARVT